MPLPTQNNSVGPYDPEYARWASMQAAPQPLPDADDSPGLVSLLLNRRKALVVCAIVSACCALLLTLWNRSQSWTHEMVISYQPQMKTNVGISSPNVNTLGTFLQAPEIEQTMRDEFPNYDFGKDFEKAFGIKVPYGTQAIEIKLKTEDTSHSEAFHEWCASLVQLETWSKRPAFGEEWQRLNVEADAKVRANREQSKQVLNRLRTVFAEYIANHRQEMIQDRLRDLKAANDEWTEKLKNYRGDLDEFNRTNQVQDLQNETTALLAAVSSWEARLEDARLTKTSTDQELGEVQRRLQALKEAAATTKKEVDGIEQLSESPQAQIERVNREREVKRLKTEVSRLETQHEFDKRLHEKKFMSEAEFQQKRLALESIRDQLKDAEKVLKLQQQVQEEAIATGTSGGGVGSDVRGRTLALELQAITGKESIKYLEKKLVEKREQLSRLRSLREDAEHIGDQILLAQGELQHIASRMFQLEYLQSDTREEFKSIRAATLDRSSVKSTDKKWFVVAFVLCGLLFSAPILARDLMPDRKDGVEGHAEQLGIPMLVGDATMPLLSSAKSMAPTDYDERSRLLALRIQQAVPRSDEGAVVLFSGLDQAADVKLMSKLANCWARRGERVLLLDTGDEMEVQTGLAELLAADQVTLESKSNMSIANGKDNKNGTNGDARKSSDDAAHDQSENLPAAQQDKNGLPQIAMAGLSNFLKDDSVDWQQLVQQTEIQGVDCVMAGDLPMPAEGLATHRMTDFLGELRERYSLIVLMGPSTSRPVDLELLASRADGIVFSTDGSNQVSEHSQAAVKNLVDLNAPVLGIIS